MMTLEVNGERRDVSSAITVADLVHELGLPGSTLLIEHNGTALLRSDWAGTAISNDDRLEILRVSAGG